MTRDRIVELVFAERARQFAKWGSAHDFGEGDCSSPHVHEAVKVAVLLEEVGEVAKALLEQDREGWRIELVQVAAVAFAILEGVEE